MISYVTFRNTQQMNMATRILLVSILELIAVQIKETRTNPQLKKQITNVIQLLFNYFLDPFQKVRYQAISSIYNIISYYGTCYLPLFTRTFHSLFPVVTDQNPEIRLVVFHLNHSLKNLLNELISAHQYFDVNEFMSLLIQNFITQTSNIKEFIIDWLIVIDQIPQFEISFYLPLVFKELFKLMEGQHQALKDKSQECLKNFLSSFKELLRNRSRIEEKIREDSFSMLLGVLLEVIKQSLNSAVKHYALQWLQVFTQLFYNELIKKQHVEVRRSSRSQYFLKQMKQPKNPERTSKILSLIIQEIMQAQSESVSQSLTILNGMDFMPTLRQKISQNSMINSVVEQNSLEQDENPLRESLHLSKTFTSSEKVTEFLVQIFLSYYSKIIILVMHSFSDDDEKIRRTTIKINNILLDSFPVVQDKAKISRSDSPIHTIITNQSQSYLQKLQIPLIIKLGKFLKESRTSHKIEAIIKWIKILYEKGTNPQLNLQISSLIQKIVEKICEKPSNSQPMGSSLINNKGLAVFQGSGQSCFNFNKELFNLLADSIFMLKYLDLFIQTLLSYFYQNQGIDSQKIIIDIISMKIKYQYYGSNGQDEKGNAQKSDELRGQTTDSTQIIYITILKRLVLFQAQKGRFKQKMIQNLISILITEDSLTGLRKKLRNTPIRARHLGLNKTKHVQSRQSQEKNQIISLIRQLFQYFCLNEGFSIMFCFLTGMYSLINKILKYIAEQNLLDRPRIKSFVKASNLLECYNLSHCKIDILKSQMALKGYLGYLMVIPPSKLNRVLLNRIPEGFTLVIQDSSEKQQDDDLIVSSLEEELFQSYLKLIEKHRQETLLIEKGQQKRRERERQASISIQLTKQLRPQSKSILRSTPSRIVKQSQSQKKLKPSFSFKIMPSHQSHKQLSTAQVQRRDKSLQSSNSDRLLQTFHNNSLQTLNYKQSQRYFERTQSQRKQQIMSNLYHSPEKYQSTFNQIRQEIKKQEEKIQQNKKSKVKVIDMRII